MAKKCLALLLLLVVTGCAGSRATITPVAVPVAARPAG